MMRVRSICTILSHIFWLFLFFARFHMDTLDKKSLLEKQIEDQFIIPALQKSG